MALPGHSGFPERSKQGRTDAPILSSSPTRAFCNCDNANASCGQRNSLFKCSDGDAIPNDYASPNRHSGAHCYTSTNTGVGYNTDTSARNTRRIGPGHMVSKDGYVSRESLLLKPRGEFLPRQRHTCWKRPVHLRQRGNNAHHRGNQRHGRRIWERGVDFHC